MINKVTLLGNVGAEPEIRSTSTGTRVGNLRLATNERVRADGEWTEHTEWHRVVVWGRLADIVEQYVSTGRQLYIEGVLRTRSWDDADGNRKWSTEVHVRELKLLGGRDRDGDRFVTAADAGRGGTDGAADEVPF